MRLMSCRDNDKVVHTNKGAEVDRDNERDEVNVDYGVNYNDEDDEDGEDGEDSEDGEKTVC